MRAYTMPVRVVRWGQTINTRDRRRTLYSDCSGWITGRYARKAIRCAHLAGDTTDPRKKRKWDKASQKAIAKAILLSVRCQQSKKSIDK